MNTTTAALRCMLYHWALSANRGPGSGNERAKRFAFLKMWHSVISKQGLSVLVRHIEDVLRGRAVLEGGILLLGAGLCEKDPGVIQLVFKTLSHQQESLRLAAIRAAALYKDLSIPVMGALVELSMTSREKKELEACEWAILFDHRPCVECAARWLAGIDWCPVLAKEDR